MKTLAVALLCVLSLTGLFAASEAQADLRPRIEPRMHAPAPLPGSGDLGLGADKDRDRQRREQERRREEERRREQERKRGDQGQDRNDRKRRGTDREEGEEELNRTLRLPGLSAAQVDALEQVDPGALEDLLRLRAAAHGLGGR